MICLATPHLLLRTWRTEDRCDLEALLCGSVPSHGNLDSPHLGGTSQATAVIEYLDAAWLHTGHGIFAVESLADGSLLGLAGFALRANDSSPLELVWQIAALTVAGVAHDATNHETVAHETVAAVIDWAFGLLDIVAIESTVGAADTISCQVAERVGMTMTNSTINPATTHWTKRYVITMSSWNGEEVRR